MKRWVLVALVCLASVGAAQRDPLVQARQLYNQQQYDAAIAAAAEAAQRPNLADPAALVLGRAHIERFRLTADVSDLSAARNAFARIRPARLTAPERIELVVGFGGLLYADGRFGAAAEQFELALPPLTQTTPADARVLEWWASALDRQAQLLPGAAQRPLYERILQRVEQELGRDPASAVATYWLAAAARGLGDLQRAWDAAVAGWIRATLTGGQADKLRSDLDRLVRQALIPERARQFGSPKDVQQVLAAMEIEWQMLKQTWAPAAGEGLP